MGCTKPKVTSLYSGSGHSALAKAADSKRHTGCFAAACAVQKRVNIGHCQRILQRIHIVKNCSRRLWRSAVICVIASDRFDSSSLKTILRSPALSSFTFSLSTFTRLPIFSSERFAFAVIVIFLGMPVSAMPNIFAG